jgi:Tfp pilus assembly protein PilW
MAGISRTAAGAPARRMRGGTLVGFMIGLIVGLAVAVVVALFVTRAPVPFVNKAGRASDRPSGAAPKSATR